MSYHKIRIEERGGKESQGFRTDWSKMTLAQIRRDVCEMMVNFGWSVWTRDSRQSCSMYVLGFKGYREVCVRVSDHLMHPNGRNVDVSVGHKKGSTRKQLADFLTYGDEFRPIVKTAKVKQYKPKPKRRKQDW